MPVTNQPSQHRAERQSKTQPIFEILHKDHETVAGLFQAIEAATDADDRFSLCQLLVRELKLHAHAEEDIFYDRLEHEMAAKRRMSESRDDHADIDLQLDRLARLEGDDERLLQLVHDLKQDVERHVKHEEEEVFVAAEALFDPGEAEELTTAFLQRKKQLASGALGLTDDANDADDADLSEEVTRPVSLQTAAPQLDQGLEDRGVGSDGDSAALEAASIDPDSSTPSSSEASQNAATDWDESEASDPIDADDAAAYAAGGEVDSADKPSSSPVAAPKTSEQPQMDQGLEDRGIGSPTPAPTKPSGATGPTFPLKPHDPEKQKAKHDKKAHPKGQPATVENDGKVHASKGFHQGAPPRGFEGPNSGGRNGERAQRENHLSRDKQVPRVHDGRGKAGPENDR